MFVLAVDIVVCCLGGFRPLASELRLQPTVLQQRSGEGHRYSPHEDACHLTSLLPCVFIADAYFWAVLRVEAAEGDATEGDVQNLVRDNNPGSEIKLFPLANSHLSHVYDFNFLHLYV